MLLMNFLLVTSALSATTDEKLQACDQALYAKVKEAQLCSLGVDLYKEARQNDQKEIAELRSRGSAWYENKVVWLALGVFLGAYAARR